MTWFTENLSLLKELQGRTVYKHLFLILEYLVREGFQSNIHRDQQ